MFPSSLTIHSLGRLYEGGKSVLPGAAAITVLYKRLNDCARV